MAVRSEWLGGGAGTLASKAFDGNRGNRQMPYSCKTGLDGRKLTRFLGQNERLASKAFDYGLITLIGGRMKPVLISRVQIDAKGWLRLYPAGERYDHIYRAAAGVEWDKTGGFLHAEEPGTWTYPAYFGQIVSAVASEYGDMLAVSPATEWSNVPADIRAAIQAT